MPDRSSPPKTLRPLDAARLEELALAYVARFATTAGKLRAYLARKLRERGWEGEESPPVEVLVARFVAAGYIDDVAWARAKSGSLMRRGYGLRRVRQALDAAGVDAAIGAAARPGVGAQRHAALALARKRGFGPFGRQARDQPLDRPLREKQIAAMLRAGHPLDSARELIDAVTVAAAEEWAAAIADEDGDRL